MCNCKHSGIHGGHFCCYENKVQTLGLVASSRRKVANGEQYDHLFPKANLQDKIVNPNGSVSYTVEQMEKVVQDYHWQTAKVATTLKADTLPQELENVWNFGYKHYQYKLDKDGVEELRTPARAWHDGQILARSPLTADIAGIDCDCFSITIACILTNLKIAHKLRITAYSGGWQHVYVVVPVPGNPSRNWILDCVLDKFNTEKTYSNKFDYKMNGLGIPVAILSGMDQDATELHGIISGDDFVIEGFNGLTDDDSIEGTDEELGAADVQYLLSSAESDLGALKRHLTRTRNHIAKNPESVVFQGGARNNLERLDYVLAHWDTPNRMRALTEAAKHEHAVNVSMGFAGAGDFNEFDGADDPTDLSGILQEDENGNLGEIDIELRGADDDAIDGLGKPKKGQKVIQNVRKAAGNAAKKISAATKKVATVTKKTAGNVAKKTVVVTKKVAKKVATAAKKAVKATIRYNPLTLAARGGYLLFLTEGWLDMAKSLRPAYWSKEEAAGKGITADQWEASVRALQGVRNIFINTLQGKEENLKKAIIKGSAAKGLRGSDDNLGAPVVAAIAAAAAPIAATAKAMDDAGIKDKEGFVKKVTNFFKNVGTKIKGAVQKNKEKKAAKNAASDTAGENGGAAGKSSGTSNEGGGSNESGASNEGSGSSERGSSSSDADSDAGGEIIDKVLDNAGKVAAGAASGEGDGENSNGDTSNGGGGSQSNNSKPVQKKDDAKDGIFTKALNFAKENPGKVAIGTVVLATSITLAVSPKARKAVFGIFSKKKGGLSGTGKKRRKKSKTTNRPATSTKRRTSKRKVSYVKM